MMSVSNPNYGSTPLINRQRKQNKFKTDTCCCIAKLILISTLCIVAYHIFSNLSMNNNLYSKQYSKQFNEDATERKTIIIRYEYEDFLNFAPDSSTSLSPLDSEIWRSFHEELIFENGYDVNDKSNLYVFQVFDVQTDVKTAKPTRAPNTPRPTKSPNTPRPTKSPKTTKPTKAPNTPRPTKAPNTPRPTKAPNTPRPTKAPKTPKPTKPPNTPRPTKSPNTPRPTKAPKTFRPTKSPVTTPPTPAPTPFQSNMQCFTRYTDLGLGQSLDGEEGASVAVNCLNEPGLEKAELVGCVTYSPGNDGFTSGEIIELTDERLGDKPQCTAWHRNSDDDRDYPITIGARCCDSTIDDNNDRLYLNLGTRNDSGATYYDREGGEYCSELSQCNNWDKYNYKGPTETAVPIICTSFYGEWQSTGCSAENPMDCGGWTGKSIGTKYIEQNGGASGCRGSRGEIGYLEQRMGCIGSAKGTMDCKWVLSDSANLNEVLQKYESFAECPYGYVVADCNAYVDDAINWCDFKAYELGTSYGGHYPLDPSIQGCIAVGNTQNIRAQASCCRVDGG